MHLQGKVTISNDGATIMKLLEVVHPAAKVLVDISLSQDSEVCPSSDTELFCTADLCAHLTVSVCVCVCDR